MNLTRFLKNYAVIILLLLGIGIRIHYFIYDPRPILQADAYGYFNIGAGITKNNMLPVFISNFRMPLYPFIIYSVVHPKDPLDPTRYYPSFPGDKNILLFQTFCGLGTLILTILILKQLHSSVWSMYISVFLVATETSMLYFEHSIMPDAFATLLLTLFGYLMLKTVKKYSLSLSRISFFISVMLFLTKPIFMLLPLFFWVLIPVIQRAKKTILTSFISILLYVFIVLGYSIGNTVIHGYHGINHTSDINMLGRIMQFNLPIEAGKNEQFIYNKLTEYKNLSLPSNPYRFLEWADYSIWSNPQRLTELQLFSKNILKDNFLSYIYKAIPDVITSLSKTDLRFSEYIAPGKTGDALWPLHFFYTLGSIFKYSSFLLFLFFPVHVLYWIISTRKKEKNQTRTNLNIVVSAIPLYMAVMVGIGSYDSFGRLTIPAIPLTIISSVIAMEWAVRGIKNFVGKKHNVFIEK